MDKANSKIMTLSFLAFAALIGFTVATLVTVLSSAFGIVAKITDLDVVRHGLPIVVALGTFLYLQLNKDILSWADEVITEIKKVVWPPTKDVKGMTIVVVIMVMLSAVIIATFDMLSGFVLNQLIK